jgi:hypothetical protein
MKQKLLVSPVEIRYYVDKCCVAVGFGYYRLGPNGEVVPAADAFVHTHN